MAATRKSSRSLDLLDPQTLARIGGLELVARTVVDGVMSGMHRSTHKGGCCEFDEHRLYAAGDDLRLIDWRLFARRDRHYVKQFEDETNLQAWLVVDTSGSMAFGHTTMSKFDYARMGAACLARLLLKQRDSIGLMLDVDGRRIAIPPRPQANHFLSIVDRLQSCTAVGPTQLAHTLQELAARIRRRGLVVVFSDCFGDVASLKQALHQLRLRGHDVLVFQVLAPEEVSFDFRSPAVFEDLEVQGVRLDIYPGAIRRHYVKQFEAYMRDLYAALVEIDCDLVTLSTDRDLGDSLAYYLRRRAARRRVQSARSG
ncbi:MAG: DUF58 domain-containing protein [Planctomycetaceae bacterium]|nr:DUF58 domain-containing protein [Planctomycetaceae bacterium]